MHQFHRRLTVVALGLIMVGLIGAARPGAQPVKQENGGGGRPKVVFAVEHIAGENSDSSGLVCVGWEDGLVIFATSPEKAGKNLLVGNITTEQVKKVLAELKEAGFFELATNRGHVPDASYTTMSATLDGKKVDGEWMEWLRPGIDANADADPKFYKFAKMWRLSRTILLFASPKDSKPLEKDVNAQKRRDAARGAGEIHY